MVIQKYIGGDRNGNWSIWLKHSMITGTSVEVVHEVTMTTFFYDPEDAKWWKNPAPRGISPPAPIRDRAERAWKKGTASLSGKPDLRITG